MNEVYENKNLSDYLKTFGLKEKVVFGESLKILNGKIIIPNNYKNIDSENNLGFIFLLLGLCDLELGITDNYEDLISKNEFEQLKNLFSFLKVYEKSGESFFNNTQNIIGKYLDNLSEEIDNFSSLQAFLKEKLLIKKISNFKNLVNEYINFKKLFLENNNSNNNSENEGIHENNDYFEHDGNLGESIEGENNNIFGTIEPFVSSKYFAENSFDFFNHKTGKFEKDVIKKQKLEVKKIDKTTNFYFYSGKKGQHYNLPFDNHNLSISDWNNEEIEIFIDNYGNYSINFLKDVKTKIGIFQEKNSFSEKRFSNSQIIYTGSKIDFSQFDKPDDIINYIRKNKKYKNVSQQQFNTGNTNTDIEKLFESEELDCLPANKLFSILCRNLGFPSRFIVGIIAKTIKDKQTNKIKTNLSKSSGHAWCEVFINGKWQVFDATPIKQDKDESKNEETNLLNQAKEIFEQKLAENSNEIENQEIEKTQDEVSKQVKKNLEEYNNAETKDNEIENQEIEKTQDEVPKQIKENLEEYNNAETKDFEETINELTNNTENQYLKSACDYVKNDALEIIEYIKMVLKKRNLEMRKKAFSMKKQRYKKNTSKGKLKINSNSIRNISVGNPNIFSKKTKFNPNLEKDIDTRLQDISLAIDISCSMGDITGNWENGKKLDYAYLSMILLYLVTKELNINFEKVILFGDKEESFPPEKIIKRLKISYGGNDGNYLGIEKSLKMIENSKKGVTFILSDGDGGHGQDFFNENSIDILKNNQNIIVLGYGLGKDASEKLNEKIQNGKIPTAIEARMQEANNDLQSKGFPLENYKNLVQKMKIDLTKLMTNSKIVL